MNKSSQRIAIAELCGWTPYNMENSQIRYWRPPQGDQWSHQVHQLPDYLNDLNACREFEKYIRAKLNRRNGVVYAYVYENHLSKLTFGEPIYATAPQRCEAFLKTINKWTNDH